MNKKQEELTIDQQKYLSEIEKRVNLIYSVEINNSEAVKLWNSVKDKKT